MCLQPEKGTSELQPSSSDSALDDASSISLSTEDASACASTTYGESKMHECAQGGKFSIVFTWHSLAIILTLAVASAFSVGAVFHSMLLAHTRQGLCHHMTHSPNNNRVNPHVSLPQPTITENDAMPPGDNSTKMFLKETVRMSNTFHLNKTIGFQLHCSGLDEASAGSAASIQISSHDGIEDPSNGISNFHLPVGQHLFLDIKHVSSGFLNSEHRLAQAIAGLFEDIKLAPLFYNRCSVVPKGISCMGFSSEIRVSLRTWPSEGVVLMDLISPRTESPISILPLITKLFAVPGLDMLGDSSVEPAVVWSQKLRGFREGFSPIQKARKDPLEADLGKTLARHGLDMKVELISKETGFQRADVYELIDPLFSSLALYKKSLSGDGSYESRHRDQFRPEKILYLDGVEQSNLDGDAAYHEALVHPAMMAHPNPRRVAIVGGGEGATLREVLKHGTVEEVVMVEIDEGLVALCREHLPEWTNCTDNAGSDADSCFDDSRATLVFMDASEWFKDAFGKIDKVDDDDAFDVIIMDALDPESYRTADIVAPLYKGSFIEAIYNGLSEEGVFVVQMGQAPALRDPPDEAGPGIDKVVMVEALESVGFASMHRYDEAHSHFNAPWSYLVSFKDEKSRASWYRSAAEVDLELRRRLHGTRSGVRPLRFFDASTMMGYQFPSRQQEAVHCRSAEKPWECDEYAGIDPGLLDVPVEHLEARGSGLGQFAGRGLFAARDIPEGSTFALDLAVKAFHVLPSTFSVVVGLRDWTEDNVERCTHVKDVISAVLAFTEGYGYGATLLGRTHYSVDAGITTFCNHGCNGTYTYGDEDINYTEMGVSLAGTPEDLLNKASTAYSPVLERHLRQILVTGDYTLRDIKKGEEILCNYLSFVANPDEWEEDVKSLRSQCAGETIGHIAEYELKAATADQLVAKPLHFSKT